MSPAKRLNLRPKYPPVPLVAGIYTPQAPGSASGGKAPCVSAWHTPLIEDALGRGKVCTLYLSGFGKVRRVPRKVRHQPACELVDGRRPATRRVAQLVHTLHKLPAFLFENRYGLPDFLPRLTVVGVSPQCEQFLIASNAAIIVWHRSGACVCVGRAVASSTCDSGCSAETSALSLPGRAFIHLFLVGNCCKSLVNSER